MASIPSSPVSTRQSLESTSESLALSRASNRGDTPLGWSLDRYRSSPTVAGQSGGFNALSTVLNHPNKRPKPLRPSRYPLPTLSPVDLRQTNTSCVDDYLKEIEDSYHDFINDSSDKNNLNDDNNENDLTSLDEIPRLFFKPDFDLGDPRTFDVVTKTISDSTSIDNFESPEDIGINEIIHARLSNYANTVDRQLIHELSHRAPSLFKALDNLKHLSDYASEGLEKFDDLQFSLEDLISGKINTIIESIYNLKRRQNLDNTLGVINDIENINDAIVALEQMIDFGHNFDALDLIDNLFSSIIENKQCDKESLIELKSSIDFNQLNVLADISSILESNKSKVIQTLSQELSETLFNNFDDNIKLNESEINFDKETLINEIKPLVNVFDKYGSLDESFQVYEDKVTKKIIKVYFNALPHQIKSQAIDVDVKSGNGTISSQLLKELRLFETTDYIKYLNTFSIIQKSAMNILDYQKEVFKSVLECLEKKNKNDELLDFFTKIKNNVIGISFMEISGIINSRKDIEAELPLQSYLEFHNTLIKYAEETVSHGSNDSKVVLLKDSISDQFHEFLDTFHASYTTQSAKLVETEIWSQAEIPQDVQSVIKLIVESAIKNIPELLIKDKKDKIINESLNEGQKENQINIEGHNYFSVEALNKVLLLLIDYFCVLFNVPSSAIEIMTKIIEFLKQFNSRTCQVVLGAGAMRSAGLKNITAKHLALSSQALSVMVALIPYIREAVRRQLDSNQATHLIEFDRLKRDYQEHQYEIHAKLVSILGDRLTAHTKSLSLIKFDKPNQGNRNSSTYAEGLVKETATLHRVLSKYLPRVTLQFVFKQVFDAINKRIGDQYQRLTLKTEIGKSRMIEDANFLCSRLNSLQGIDPLGTTLIETVESRQIDVSAPTPVDSPRPSLSTDFDPTSKRSVSLDIQSRVSSDLPMQTNNQEVDFLSSQNNKSEYGKNDIENIRTSKESNEIDNSKEIENFPEKSESSNDQKNDTSADNLNDLEYKEGKIKEEQQPNKDTGYLSHEVSNNKHEEIIEKSNRDREEQKDSETEGTVATHNENSKKENVNDLQIESEELPIEKKGCNDNLNNERINETKEDIREQKIENNQRNIESQNEQSEDMKESEVEVSENNNSDNQGQILITEENKDVNSLENKNENLNNENEVEIQNSEKDADYSTRKSESVEIIDKKMEAEVNDDDKSSLENQQDTKNAYDNVIPKPQPSNKSKQKKRKGKKGKK